MTRLTSYRKPSLLALIFLAAAISSLAACATQKAPTATMPGSVTVESLVVMPYIDMYKIYGDNISFNCPLCGRSEVISKVSEGADEFLTETLFAMLQQQGGYHLIPPGEALGVQSTLLLNLDIGKTLGADAVLLGRVYRFREREGEAYAAQTSAAVTFDLLLIYVADGQLLWEGHYSETQQALTENLYNIGAFFDRKGKWLTAQELAAGGLETVMATFPKSN